MNDEFERDDERLFAGLEPPPPPADLRAGALDAARRRIAETRDRDLWSKIWNHGGVRVAWAAAVVILLVGHAVVGPNRGAVSPPNPPVLANDHGDEQFLEILRPVRIDADAHPTIGLFTVAADMDQIENGGNPS